MSGEPFVFHEVFKTGTGKDAWRVGTICETAAEAADVGLMLKARKPASAYTPALDAGEPFDAPEFVPPRVDPPPPNCDGFAELIAQAAHDHAENGGECTALGCVVLRD